jgi:PAS domain S-box-containing protein
MFRPIPEHTVFQAIPFRLIVSVLLILALAVSVILLFSIEHEKTVVQGLTSGRDVPTNMFPALWQSRRDLIAIAVLLFVVSGVGIAAVVTHQHYQSTLKTLEAVKGLARNILHSLPTGIVTISGRGMITAVNPKAEAILGRHVTALLGYSYEEVFPEGDTIRALLSDALKKDRYTREKDFPYPETTTGDTGTIRVSTVELRGEEGALDGVILQVQDVSELLILERRLRNAEKLAALHTLSAGVAHEIRNPLSALDLNAHLLEEELREQKVAVPKVSSYLDVVNVEIRRLKGILDSFLKFARPASVEMSEIRIEDVVTHIVHLLHYETAERQVRLETAVGLGLPRVLGDETQLSQVLLNLVVNAVQSMPAGGVCRIAVNRRRYEGREWVELVIQDTGTGIKHQDLPRLFEPFFTTKPTGSGLGLAIAYRIVEDHGGQIQVSSEEGRGTTVIVRLPVAGRLAEKVEA